MICTSLPPDSEDPCSCIF